MALDRDLFLALLSLDAYNRDYNARVGKLSAAAGTGLGTASIVVSSPIQSAGFYAIAYETTASIQDLPLGTTIIAYRGTDDGFDRSGSGDVYNGYGIAIGSPDGLQARARARADGVVAAGTRA